MPTVRDLVRAALGVTVVVAGLSVAGCGSSPADPAGRLAASTRSTGTPTKAATAATAPSARASKGVLHGVVRQRPGQDPRSGGAGGGRHQSVNGDPVHVRPVNSMGDPVSGATAGATTDRHGEFELTLAPGRYRVTEDTCGASRSVRVDAGTTSQVVLDIADGCR